jgi:hypothetical protein
MGASSASAPPQWLQLAPRVVLAGLFAAIVALYLGADRIEQVSAFRLAFDLTSTSAGTAQLFYDRGTGFSEAESSTAPIAPSTTPFEVSFTIPAGRYSALRLDPNNGPGDYAISNLRIDDATGRVRYRPDADTVTASGGATVRTANSVLIVTAPPGVSDPGLIIQPRAPVVLRVASRQLLTLALAFLVSFAAALALLTLIDVREGPQTRRTPRLQLLARRHAHATVIIMAVVAAVSATYPLLLGKSLVSPANGPVVMLYDHAPFVPGGVDFVTEDARGADTGALLWSILPYSKVQREAVAAGEWPLWERYNGLGRPLWGSGLSTFLDPLHLLTLLVKDPAVGWDLKFFYGRIAFAVGIGVLAHAATRSAWAAIIVACAAPFFGYFTYRFNHPAYFSIMYVPWLMGALLGLARAATPRQIVKWTVLIAVAIALQLVASTPKEGAIAFGIAFAAGTLTVLLSRGPLWKWRASAVGAAAALGLLLCAPHWLIFLDTLSRAWTIYDVPQVRFASLSFVSEVFLGSAKPGSVAPSVNMVIGAGLVFAVVAVRRVWRSPIAIACAIATVAAMSVALGMVPASWLLRVPLIRNVAHVHYSFAAATIVPLTVVAAFGFREASHVLTRPQTAMVWAIIVIVLGGAVLRASNADILGQVTALVVGFAVLGAALMSITSAAMQAGVSSRFAMLSIVGAAAIVLAPGGLHLDTGFPLVDTVLMQPRNRADLDVESPATETAKAINREPFRALGVGMTLFPGTQGLWELEGLIGPDALELPYFRELGVPAGMFNDPWGWQSLFSVEDMQRQSDLLDMFGVRVVFARPEATIPFGHAVPVTPKDALQLVVRPGAWPRAFFAEGVGRYDTPLDFLVQLRANSTPFAVTQANDTDAETFAADLPRTRGRVIAAADYRLTPNSTTFTIVAPARGIAVLGEAYESHDFHSYLNGQRVPYFRVNHMYKAVTIPGAGSWVVRFEYYPSLWRTAWTMSAAGAVILLVACVWQYRAGRVQRHERSRAPTLSQ